ncbi:protein of unknown function [Methylorubrum extorquens]|uniref:Uncharacterized protein n=1 Tax=Methylorubrum extorquens TaxID=408 RepID=A0A2N9AMC7_METEX|nr:protein of unknown function [Methylorubrum extorquens]SOR28442.1 protein of unknown function [Methylorubrum extorquens]
MLLLWGHAFECLECLAKCGLRSADPNLPQVSFGLVARRSNWHLYSYFGVPQLARNVIVARFKEHNCGAVPQQIQGQRIQSHLWHRLFHQ